MFNRFHYRQPRFWFALAAMVFIALHWSAVFMPPFFDDWPVIEISRKEIEAHGPLVGIGHALMAPVGDFWRPLHILLTAPVLGESAAVSQTLKLSAIIGLALLVVRLGRVIGVSRGAEWFAGIGMLLHQGMVLGGEIDRWGDVICSAAVVGVFCESVQFTKSDIGGLRYLLRSAAWTLVAVGSKESGVVLPIIPLLVAAIYRPQLGPQRLSGHAVATVGASLIVAAYLLVRHQIGLGVTSDDPSGYYDLGFGPNVLRNIAFMVVGLLSPVNTVLMVMDVGIWRVVSVIFMVTWSALLIYGLRSFTAAFGWRTAALILVVFIVAQGPSLLMNRTTEPNFSRSLPFGILAICAIVWSAWRVGTLALRYSIIGLLCLTLGFHIHATIGKLNGLTSVAERARNFRDAVEWLMPVPPDRTVVFAAERTYTGYSVFAMPLWKSIPGDADCGMRLRYRNPRYAARVDLCDGDGAIRLAKGEADFLLDRENRLSTADGSSVRIEPVEPRYLATERN